MLKIEKGKKSESSAEDTYKPTIKWFAAMDYIMKIPFHPTPHPKCSFYLHIQPEVIPQKVFLLTLLSLYEPLAVVNFAVTHIIVGRKGGSGTCVRGRATVIGVQIATVW